MAAQVQPVGITEVGKPLLGELTPSHVHAAVEIDLSKFTGAVREEWLSLKEHDVVFLVCIERPSATAARVDNALDRERRLLSQGMLPRDSTSDFTSRDCLFEGDSAGFQWEEVVDFQAKFGIKYIRGAEIYGNDGNQSKGNEPKRRLRIKLDPAQYYLDVTAGLSDCYERINLLVRRKPKENNNKAVLDTIRDLIHAADGGRPDPPHLHKPNQSHPKPSDLQATPYLAGCMMCSSATAAPRLLTTRTSVLLTRWKI
jgi:intron-binding protein aquarius